MAKWTSRNRWAPSRWRRREKLDNLIFVINCNLQRLDGPVRGNGKVIQELEAAFRGAGWNVIKVVWGSDWDDLFARDTTGILQKRLGEDRRWRIPDIEHQGRRVPSRESVQHAGVARTGGAPVRRTAGKPASRRTRSAQSLQRLQGRGRDHRAAHGNPGPHHQRLRPRRSGRRTQHHAPAEETQRAGNSLLPLALRDSDSRRSGEKCRIFPSAGR